ncbi:hypothetical protein [Streptomyces sp. SM12]|uniref:hypothetical protein n=1 Tax=Streptomyces sp. SM12 TaxID=1071602 RepID=UPI000CD4CE5B|nr:hypothetical protein [Streptomyces sp. SM12]
MQEFESQAATQGGVTLVWPEPVDLAASYSDIHDLFLVAVIPGDPVPRKDASDEEISQCLLSIEAIDSTTWELHMRRETSGFPEIAAGWALLGSGPWAH